MDIDLGGAWSHRLFVARHRLELVLDSLFLDAPWPERARVVLYNEVDAGLGDVAFMSKFIRLLASEPGAPELVLVTTGLEKQARFTLPPEVTVIGADAAKGHPALEACDLVISAPGIFDHCRDGDAVRAALGLAADVPFLYVAEYGSIRQLRTDAYRGLADAIEDAQDAYLDRVARDAGADPDAVGFRGGSGEIVAVGDDGPRVIGQLAHFFVDPAAEGNPLAGLVSAPLLAARSCGLEAGEMGIHVDPVLLLEARRCRASLDARLETATQIAHPRVRALVLDALSHRRPVFQGYAHSGHAVFHDILTLAAPRDVDVLVISPDRRGAAAILAADFGDAMRDRLVARGFGAVVVEGRASEPDGTPERLEARWGDGPTYEVLTLFPLQHTDMTRLMLVSEPPTMVSGDQSFSDAISALKSIAVIEPVYCQTWHLDAVCALAASVDPAVESVLRAGLHYEWRPEHMDAVADAVRDPHTWEAFAALTERIARDGIVNDRLRALVKRALWTWMPQTSAVTIAWIKPILERALTHLGRGAVELQPEDRVGDRPWSARGRV